MRRDFILVIGNQGYGKSAWTMTYGAPKTRLVVFDPKAEYIGVDYMAEPADWIPQVTRGALKSFRFGTWHAEEVQAMAQAAYGAGDSTLILEECAMLFTKGAGVEEWAKPLLYMGREPRLNLVLVAQRATMIPRDVRTQAGRIITFYQQDPDDGKALAEIIGAEHRDTVSQLDFLECLDWEPRVPVKRYRIKHPRQA